VLNTLGLSALQLCIALEASMTRRLIAMVVQSNTNAQRFMEHALKQKFVGCLNATDEVLTKHAHELSEEQKLLLRSVVRACAFGLDQTYYYLLMRRHGRFGAVGGQLRTTTVAEIVHEWQSSWADDVEWREGPDDGAATRHAVTNQWDLVRLVLHKLLGQHQSNLAVSYSLDVEGLHTRGSARIDFVITRKGQVPGTTRRLSARNAENAAGLSYGIDPVIAEAMHASFVMESGGHQLRVSFSVDRSAVTLQSSSRPTTRDPAEANMTLSPGMVVGVLDDVKLVRLSVLRYLTSEFRVSADSFAMGETRQDSLVGFVDRCLNASPAVDLALIDQNLEHDDGFVLGTTVARELRRRGYLGAIVLHSANERMIALRGHEDVNDDVDGFLEKQAFQRHHVESCLLRAMRVNRERMTSRQAQLQQEGYSYGGDDIIGS
jgi:hypothetical protein